MEFVRWNLSVFFDRGENVLEYIVSVKILPVVKYCLRKSRGAQLLPDQRNRLMALNCIEKQIRLLALSGLRNAFHMIHAASDFGKSSLALARCLCCTQATRPSVKPSKSRLAMATSEPALFRCSMNSRCNSISAFVMETIRWMVSNSWRLMSIVCPSPRAAL